MAKKYITKIVPHININSEKNISFCIQIPNEKRFKIYVENELGQEQFQCLTKYMGVKSDVLFEEFLIDMNGIYCNLLCNEEEFMYNVILLMFLFLDVNNDGNILEGAYSYASHAYGFFTFFNKDKEIQERYEKIYQQSKELIKQVAISYEKEKDNNGFLYQKIKEAVNKLRQDLSIYIQNGEIFFSDYDTENQKLKGLLYKSEFHKRNRIKFDFEDISFKKKRFLTICEYYFLKNAGLVYEKRCLVCYLIVRYLQDYKGFRY